LALIVSNSPAIRPPPRRQGVAAGGHFYLAWTGHFHVDATRLRPVRYLSETQPERVFATLASIALQLPVNDTPCGTKVFRRSPALAAALERPFRSRWIFDVELLDRLLRGGATPIVPGEFEEVPLRLWRDVEGSKLRTSTMIRAGLELLALIGCRRFAGPRPPRS